MHSPSSPRRPSCRSLQVIGALTAAVIATVPIAACSPAASNEPTAAGSGQANGPGTPSPPPSLEPPAAARASAGTAFFAGSANVPVAFSVPAGWEVVANAFVLKSGADPTFGVGFLDVANLYADGCRWTLVKPAVGPTVDNLVSAYRKVPDLRAGAARPVTVDGFAGRQLQFTVPAYKAEACKDATFALLQADNAGTNTVQGEVPNYWAQTPNQQNQVLILDVHGTRLVIVTGHPPDISTQDRADIDTILRSVQIG